MAQDNQNHESQPECQKQADNRNMYLKTAVGLAFVVAGLWMTIGWWRSLVTVFKGCIGPVLILAGAITIAIAKE